METDEAMEVIKNSLSQCVKGERFIVVLDSGWIFAGSLKDEGENKWSLSFCQNVRKWNKGGFGLLTKSAKKAEATLDDCNPIVFHKSRVIFMSPIKADWHE